VRQNVVIARSARPATYKKQTAGAETDARFAARPTVCGSPRCAGRHRRSRIAEAAAAIWPPAVGHFRRNSTKSSTIFVGAERGFFYLALIAGPQLRNIEMMLPTSIPNIGSDFSREAPPAPEKLSVRAALLTIVGLALVAWLPVLLPVLVILHR
jgi:hypothetical protein